MSLSKDTKISHFEGVEHNLNDLQRRYGKSIIKVFDEQTKLEYIFMVGEFTALGTAAGAIFQNGKWAPYVFAVNSLHVLAEYPEGGLVQVGNTIFLVCRKTQRQWRRGANESTIDYSTIYSDENKKGMIHPNIVYAHSFMQTFLSPQQFADHVTNGDIRKPKIINHKLWMVSRDNYLISLYYEDMFGGMFDRQLKFIPCQETDTLIEDYLNEYGLQHI